MSILSLVGNMIEDKLLNMHTAYVAKVISTTGSTATVQPLMKMKEYGQEAKNVPVVSNIPVVHSATYKIREETRQCGVRVSGHALCKESRTHLYLEPIKAGDIVLCVCCERDISSAKKGNISTPALNHHSLSDSVVVGIIEL